MAKLRGSVVLVVAALAFSMVSGCSGDGVGSGDDTAGSSSDREMFNDEVDDVRAEVADCFVSESATEGRRYTTTVEVHNDSTATHMVVVAIEADLGRGGVSAAVEVPMGAADAWAVVSAEETTDPAGAVECASYITDLEVTLEP